MLFFQLQMAKHVLAQYIKLDIDLCTCLYLAEIGMLICVRNDGNGKGIIGNIEDRKANTIDTGRAFFDNQMCKL